MKPLPSFLLLPALAAALSAATPARPAAPAPAPGPGDRMLDQYFRDETARVGAQAFAGITTLGDWNRQRPLRQAQLLEMLGLSPLPERTDLKATVTGRLEHAEFTVENLHFQSLPGLYVTANLYVPRALGGKKVPAILYVCGHASVKEGGASMGNKTGYQHHGAWFARHGYVCLTIDTIQLGELEGVHHGTHNRGMYWWNSRGYTPAGVEAWNGVRALDYLQSRPEVDGTKLGITGRSGGGAYSWYTAAIDERIKAAVPVAGITDLHNHVVDGTVKGHCDCMFMVNTYRWDYAELAAMIAPRPLLIANSDKDSIFPLDGVQRVHRAVAAIYKLHQASDKLGLLITEGPHKDTQDLQVPAFRWFNRFLKGEDPLIRVAAEKFFAPKQLRVFPVGGHPADERTTRIHDTFVPMAAPAVPVDAAAWSRQRDAWLEALRTRVFAGWPTHRDPPGLAPVDGRMLGAIREATWEFTSQGVVRLPFRVFYTGEDKDVRKIVLHAADEQDWARSGPPAAYVGPVERGELALLLLAPRGIGPTAPTAAAVDQNHLRRRYLLLGQTVDSMRVWDICRAVDAIRSAAQFTGQPLHLSGSRHQAINALYASLFLDGLAGVELHEAPVTHLRGPDYLNVLRFLDVPQAAALAAERQPVAWRGASRDDWSWTLATAGKLGWPADRLRW